MAKGGDVFVLDMGEPVKILNLALRMIHLSGLTVRDEARPNGAIEIKYIGLRPGEKLYEELLIGNNSTRTEHPLIMRAVEEAMPWSELHPLLATIEDACNHFDSDRAVMLLSSAVPLPGRPTESAEMIAESRTLHRQPKLQVVNLSPSLNEQV